MTIPKSVTLVEVGPRDGFQNVKEFIPTEDKISIINALIESGVKQMEITSFVNPKWLPQMSDATTIVKEVLKTAPSDFRAIALTPNLRGVSNAVNAGLRDVTYVISASESHNKSNVNRDIETSLDDLKTIIETYPDIQIRVSLATSFGCPFEGDVPVENVTGILKRIVSLGINEIVLCDTIGVANPIQVTKLIKKVREVVSDINLGLHFHDTRGMGIANIYAGLIEGVSIYETSLGGLGGCPFAPGSAGNTASEDMLNMFNEMGIEHKIDLNKYSKAVEIVKEKVNAPVTGRLANKCS